jgi:hypothetical protein
MDEDQKSLIHHYLGHPSLSRLKNIYFVAIICLVMFPEYYERKTKNILRYYIFLVQNK